MIGKRILSLFRRRKSESIRRPADDPVTPTEAVEESRPPPSILLELQQTHEKQDSMMPEVDLEEVMEWEPDKQTVEALKTMNVALDEFRHEALRLAMEDESEREIFRSADKLVSKIEESNLDRRDEIRLRLAQSLRETVTIIRRQQKHSEPLKSTAKTLVPQPAPKDRIEHQNSISENIRHPKSARLITEETQLKTIEDYVQYEEVLRGKIELNTVYLLPIKRSALPTALIASQIKGENVINVEKHVYGKYVKPLPKNAVLVLTRPTYRKNLVARIRPSPDQVYNRKLKRMLKGNDVATLIITEEMYEIDEELQIILKSKGFKIKKVKLDTEAARRRLENTNICHTKQAALLEISAALMPRLPELLKEEKNSEDLDGVKSYLSDLKLKPKDREEVIEIIKNVLKGNSEYTNNQLAIALGVKDDTAPKPFRNRLKSFGENLSANEKVEKLVIALFPSVIYLLFLIISLAL